jgi:hypothetical protein
MEAASDCFDLGRVHEVTDGQLDQLDVDTLDSIAYTEALMQ